MRKRDAVNRLNARLLQLRIIQYSGLLLSAHSIDKSRTYLNRLVERQQCYVPSVLRNGSACIPNALTGWLLPQIILATDEYFPRSPSRLERVMERNVLLGQFTRLVGEGLWSLGVWPLEIWLSVHVNLLSD